MENKLLFLADSYDLVVGDTFELFYQGFIRSMNPYKYYIKVTCAKGKANPRYFTFTPKANEVGDYNLNVSLYDDYLNLIESSNTILRVVEAKKPNHKLNVLCFGDSLTFNGVWPYEGYRRFSKTDGEPLGLGFSDSLNFVGTCHKEEIGYEGYGGWKWREFCNNDTFDVSSGVWIVYPNHPFDEHDQHSLWECNGLEWVLESIKKDELKFKRGKNNYYCGSTMNGTFKHLSGGSHFDDIVIDKYYFEKGNPFFDKELNDISFKTYCSRNGFEGLDLVYVLLTWNGQYIPFNHDFSLHDMYIKKILRQIHSDYPKCMVTLIGIQPPSLNGGIAANYGASGPYSDVFGELSTSFYYNEYLEQLTQSDEFKTYTRYVDLKAQFDVENNMPQILTKVNQRSSKMELIGTNGVHPTMDGYLQIGDCFFRALVHDVLKVGEKNEN